MAFIDQFRQRIILLSAVCLWLAAFLIYHDTMSRSVGFIDSGELAAAATTLGIAHPTGYPLFTLLGNLFAHMPVSSEIIVRLNILSALFTSAGVMVFFLLCVEFFTLLGRTDSRQTMIVSLFAAVALGTSKTVWSQSISFEVYSLHMLFLPLTLLLFVNAVRTGSGKRWILFAFLLGLAFTNHLTMVLLAPALLFWFFSEYGLRKQTFNFIAKLSIPFAAGCSLYLVLPIRASQHPLLNWGNPQTLESFWRHVTGKQFRIWMFSSGEVARKQLNYFFDNLLTEFHAVILFCAIIGAIGLWIANRRLFMWVLLLFAGCIAYSINYDIHDIDAYFLLAYLAVGIAAAVGIDAVVRRFKTPAVRILLIIVFGGSLLMQWSSNRRINDHSENFLVEDYTMNILTHAPPNAVILSQQWDYFISASYYYQHTKKIRPDVVVLDKELFRRSWYFPQLAQMYPELMKQSATEISLFQKELYKFENDLPYDYASIEGRYTELLKSFYRNNPDRPIFVTNEIEPQYTAGTLRIPEGFLMRLTSDTAYRPFDGDLIQMREIKGTDKYSNALKGIIASGYKKRAEYEDYFGKSENSERYLNKIRLLYPDYRRTVSKY